MELKSGFYASERKDRKYAAIDMSRMFSAVYPVNGIIAGRCRLYLNDDGTVTVLECEVWCNGRHVLVEDETLPQRPSEGDYILVGVDPAKRAGSVLLADAATTKKLLPPVKTAEDRAAYIPVGVFKNGAVVSLVAQYVPELKYDVPMLSWPGQASGLGNVQQGLRGTFDNKTSALIKTVKDGCTPPDIADGSYEIPSTDEILARIKKMSKTIGEASA